MSKEVFDRGLAIRKQVLGAEFVEKSFGFVTEVIDAQRDMTMRLIKATTAAPIKNGAKQAA